MQKYSNPKYKFLNFIYKSGWEKIFLITKCEQLLTIKWETNKNEIIKKKSFSLKHEISEVQIVKTHFFTKKFRTHLLFVMYNNQEIKLIKFRDGSIVHKI